MPPSSFASTDGNMNQPGLDKNADPVTPLPEGHEPITPEFLRKLLEELDEVRDERGRLMAEEFKCPPSIGNKPEKSNVKLSIQRRRESEEMSLKEDALMARINYYRWLIPRLNAGAPENQSVSA